MSIDDKTFSFEFAPGVSPKSHREYLTLGDIAKMLQTPGTEKQEKSYVAGELKNNYRKNVNVINRSVITLDLDGAQEGGFEALCGYLSDFYYFWHTSYSHSEEKLSYRVLVPLAEPLPPSQYGDLVRSIISDNPKASIDPASAKPSQCMFTPASKDFFSYDYGVHEGALANGREWLRVFNKGEAVISVGRTDRKRDPYKIQGIVGRFNRAYRDLDELIRVFDLPYTQDATGRYHYDYADSSKPAGLKEIDERPGLYHSWHGSDPAGGNQTNNAFDLVRLHKFHHLDKEYEVERGKELASATDPKEREAIRKKYSANSYPSYNAMREFLESCEDFLVREQDLAYQPYLDAISSREDSTSRSANTHEGDVAESQERGSTDLGWLRQLQLDAKTQQPVNSLKNLGLIFQNDPSLRDIWFCTRGNYYTTSRLDTWMNYPAPERVDIGDEEILDFRQTLEDDYGLAVTNERIEQALRKKGKDSEFDPVKEYLDSLTWDGEKRLETCLPGLEEHTEYTRMVARRSILAAVARVYEPGCGADQTLILVGRERRGKSEWISRMCKGMEVALGDIKNKDTLLDSHKAWIVVSNEAGALKQADFDELKDFMTRKQDTYRAPYARRSRTYQRRWIIWGSTNEMEFLREREGNRRFLLVECPGRLDFDLFTPEYVDQIWAEAVHAYKMGETHRLNDHEEALAAKERLKYTRSDAWTESIEELLRLPVQKNWFNLRLNERSRRIRQLEEGIYETLGAASSPADTQRESITPLEAWVEALGGLPRDFSREDQSRVASAMSALVSRGVLRKESKKRHIPGQGQQFVYYINHDVLETY